MINELYELLTAIERTDLEAATIDQLIDTKRELQRMIRDVEAHIAQRQENQ